MHSTDLLIQIFIFLLAAVIFVPIFKRVGLGSVLGYLIAGSIIGPYALELVGKEVEDVMAIAEFGVVMMLFLVGLELKPSRLWKMRLPILGLGGLQVVITSMAIAGVALMFDLVWQEALVIGMVLSLSSTAIVLQTLSEKGLLGTPAGKSTFSVLLFQDVAIIPMLAVMPLLAIATAPEVTDGGHASYSGWEQALMVLGMVIGLILAGRFLFRPMFRYIAETRMREIFIATALLLVVGISIVMIEIGLSAALGSFLAGVVLAESEYRHELESEISAFKGLLLGLFFITVGASVNFALLLSEPLLILGLAAALIAVKMVVLYFLATVFKMNPSHKHLFAFALAQGGEFGFVLFAFATTNNILPAEVINTLMVVITLTMALTPVLMIINLKFIQPRYTLCEEEREADTIEESENQVIIAGFGRFGQIVGRLLVANGFETTVLESSATQIDFVRQFGHKVYYGDVGRIDLLYAAGAENATTIVIAIDDHEKSLRLIEMCRKHFPHLKIYSRAIGRRQAYEQINAGSHHIVRETLGSSLLMGRDVLKELGFTSYRAQRAMMMFFEHDEKNLHELAEYFSDEKQYMIMAKQKSADLAQVLAADREEARKEGDHEDEGELWLGGIEKANASEP